MRQATPFKKLEIDRSFVRDIVGNREALAIVTAMATLSRSLGRVITAEGVETEEQFGCLRELGCDEAQGCLISRPRQATDTRPCAGPNAG